MDSLFLTTNDSALLEDFSKGVRSFMERKGLKPKDISEVLGVSESTVKGWKYGRAFPDIPNYLKLIEIGMSPYDIMGPDLEPFAELHTEEKKIFEIQVAVKMAHTTKYAALLEDWAQNEAQNELDECKRNIEKIEERIKKIRGEK